MRSAALIAVLGFACSSPSPKPAPAPAPAAEPAPAAAPAAEPQPTAAADPAPGPELDCEEACTEWAVCWEVLNGGDFNQGGACVSACEERSEADRATYFRCIASSSDDCNAMGKC